MLFKIKLTNSLLYLKKNDLHWNMAHYFIFVLAVMQNGQEMSYFDMRNAK